MAGTLHAQDEVASGKFVVSFSATAEQKAWVARALELNVYNDLSGYARIIPIAKDEDLEQGCRGEGTQCLLHLYHEMGIDALMLGKVSPTKIEFEVYDAQKKSLVETGNISIARGSTLLQLRMGAFGAFKAFLAKGGILERRGFSGQVSPEQSLIERSGSRFSVHSETRKRLLIFMAVLVVIPYLLTLIGRPRRNPQRLSICLRWFLPYTFFCLFILGIQYSLEVNINTDIYSFVIEYFGDKRWALVAIGGLLWGYFIVANLSLIHPHFQGLERIEQNTLLPLLEAYLLTFIIKLACLLLLYSGLFFAVQHLAHVFSVTQAVVNLLLMPISGLLLLYWLGLLLEVFAMSLDQRISRRSDDFVAIWDAKIRKYFVSYMKRNGVTLDAKLLRNIIFLVGEQHGVVAYGGLFSRPRIVVDYDLVRLALGDNSPVVQEYNRPQARRSQMSLFLPHLFPRLQGKKRRIGRAKQSATLKHLTSGFMSDLNRHSSSLKIGQDKIMKGIILPTLEGKENLPSLMSDNLEDMGIVEELMQEDTVKSDPFDEDAEIDDSSHNDSDFLFGMLLHKYGDIQRWDHLFFTAYIYFFKKRAAKNTPYHFPLARYFARVSDTFVVLNAGLNHLLQYLYYRATGLTAPLTTKGNPDDLMESQHAIMVEIAKITHERKRKATRCDRFDRILWLSNFCKDPIVQLKHVRVRKPIIWGFLFSVIFFASSIALRAYNYHPRYQEIIAFEKYEISETIRKAQEQERKTQ